MVDLDADIPQEERFTEYDYMSDSDLDVDSDDEEDGVSPECVGQVYIFISDAQIKLPEHPPAPQHSTPFRSLGRPVLHLSLKLLPPAEWAAWS
jgi:hypothetical protein